MKAMIYGAGGGTSSDEVTALKKHVLSPYTTITNDSGDEIVAGTMVDNGAVNRSLKCGESYTIVEGFHNGSGVISADSLASQTGANAAAGDILTGKTAWVNGIKLTGTLPTMAGGTKTPSTSQITVACSGYKMTSNIVIPAFSLPEASKLISGYVYSIYGKSVTGTAKQFVSSPSSIYNNGKWGIASGVTRVSGLSFLADSNGVLDVNTGSGYNAGYFRLNTAVNLTDYKYLKATCSSISRCNVYIGVSTSASSIPSSFGSMISTAGGNSVADVTNLSGMYFVYFKIENRTSNSGGCKINTISLSNS